MTYRSWIVSLAVSALTLLSCSSGDSTRVDKFALGEYAGAACGLSTDIYAGQHHLAGGLDVYLIKRDGRSYLVVKASPSGGWEFSLAHLYVGTSFPGGAPGQYPYHINGEGSDAIWEEIDVTDLEGPIYVAMHFEAENPEANQNETAWAKGEGPRVSGWGWTIIFDQDDDSCTNDDDDSYNGDTEGDGGSGSYGDDAGGGSYGGNDAGTGDYPDGGDYGI